MANSLDFHWKVWISYLVVSDKGKKLKKCLSHVRGRVQLILDKIV